MTDARETAAAETVTGGDADLAVIGSVLADRARCRMLLALADGRALPASMLAGEAGVSASTASSHLGRLVDAGLLMVTARGRYRYYCLASPAVAEMIEAVGRLAPAENVRSLKQGTRAYQLRQGRTCYDHLAGRLGVAVTAGLVECGALAPAPGRPPAGVAVAHGSRNGAADVPGYTVQPAGRPRFEEIGAQLDAGCPVRCCVDWTEQKHHIAGLPGRVLLHRLLDLGWIARAPQGRAVRVTDIGHKGMLEWLGLDVEQIGA